MKSIQDKANDYKKRTFTLGKDTKGFRHETTAYYGFIAGYEEGIKDNRFVDATIFGKLSEMRNDPQIDKIAELKETLRSEIESNKNRITKNYHLKLKMKDLKIEEMKEELKVHQNFNKDRLTKYLNEAFDNSIAVNDITTSNSKEHRESVISEFLKLLKL